MGSGPRQALLVLCGSCLLRSSSRSSVTPHVSHSSSHHLVSVIQLTSGGRPHYYVSYRRSTFAQMKLPKYALPKVHAGLWFSLLFSQLQSLSTIFSRSLPTSSNESPAHSALLLHLGFPIPIWYFWLPFSMGPSPVLFPSDFSFFRILAVELPG